ncbi:MAG: LacI family DNA-binding transcriptional regulator [Tissierellia bacterium]|nr:LacI family DNA-binding transcriptional regulator [Tissierellia bacterium]
MSRKPTMEDVKNLAGVSISTVSRVINNSKPVSPDKREAVLRAIEKLGYKPNELARSLVKKKSNTIGIILDDLGIEYMAQYIRGIDEVGKLYDYDILLYSTFGDKEVQKKAVEFLSSKQVEGIIVISEHINNEILYTIKDYEIPFVLLDKYYNPEDYRTVGFDYEGAMKAMTNLFIDYNHKNIIFLTVKSHDYSSDLKQQGFELAMSEKDLTRQIFTVKENSVDSAYNFMAENIDFIHKNGITGILASSDTLAVGVIHYCYDHGISVPDDLSVSGFGNMKFSSLMRPSITTVKMTYYDVGAIAIRKLIKELRDEEKFTESVSLKFELMQRETVKTI